MESGKNVLSSLIKVLSYSAVFENLVSHIPILHLLPFNFLPLLVDSAMPRMKV